MKKPNTPSDLPVLKGFCTGGNLQVWCPWCNDWHYHGAASPGLRVPHCPRNRWDVEEYIIEPYTKKELKEISNWINDYGDWDLR
jgi:hypothetical protein